MELYEECIENRNIIPFAEAVFDIELYPTQKEIVNSIFFEEHKNIIINTYTRYGKTFSVGVALALMIMLKEKKRIGIVAPTSSDTQNLKNEMLKIGINSGMFTNLIDTSRGNEPEDLLKKRRENKITFNDGQTELILLSAMSGSMTGQIGGGRGSGAMGKGFDVLILEEAARISHDTWKKYLSRLQEKESSIRIELGNPWHKQNQFFDHWTDDSVKNFHVDEEKGKKEGRHSERWFEDQGKEVGGKNTLEYQVLYKSQFPDKTERGLIAFNDIEDAINREPFEPERTFWGFDVAGEGKDEAVLTKVGTKEDKYNLMEIYSRKYVDNASELVAWASTKLEDGAEVNVDAVGMGWGVVSMLEKKGYTANKVKVGDNPNREKEKFSNKKAQFYWKLRGIFQDGDIVISAENIGELKKQLTTIEYKFNAREKIVIEDPEKSPDYADSLMIAISKSNKKPSKILGPA